MRVLMVDDETVILEEMVEELTDQGHIVTTAENGRIGYDLFSDATHQFDVIMTDVKMPEMDGLELLDRIKQKDSMTPVIVLTGHGDLDIAVQALRLGALDFIIKPFGFETIHSTLSRVEPLLALQHESTEVKSSVQSLEMKIPSQTRLIYNVASYLKDLYESSYPQLGKHIFKIHLAIIEGMTNAVQHGNLEVASEIKEESWQKFEELLTEREALPKFGEREVIIRYTVNSNAISFEIEDEGKGFDHTQLPDFKDANSLLVSGRGLTLIHYGMDEVTWNEQGNCLKMVKQL